MKKNSSLRILLYFLFLPLNLKSQELVSFSQDTLWGYKDKMNNIVIKPQYQFSRKFINNYAVVFKNDSAGVIDKQNNIIIPFKYNNIEHLGDNRFMFGYRTKYFGEYNMGVIDTNRKIIIPAKFYYIEKNKAFYKVTKNINRILQENDSGDLRSVKSLYGLFDFNGKEIIPCNYDQLILLNDNLIVLEKDNLQALFNYKGRALTDFIYTVFGDFHDGLAKTRKGNKYGFIDKFGKIVIPIKYDYCNEFNNGLSIVTLNKKWFAIDTYGKTIVKEKNTYEEVKKVINNRN